ncbi:unnamed protein product [Prunus armeniaca]|uniref:Uncharacterized protein n=1 Tax=Prunus armeniaca TaxID=36596 RepID=A0A6J5VI22_PRUAR|nr:unnamed protein product [Prunus armeniaca]
MQPNQLQVAGAEEQCSAGGKGRTFTKGFRPFLNLDRNSEFQGIEIVRYAVASMAVASQEVILQWKHFAFVKYVGMD